MDKSYLVLSALGPDRPGLVAAIAEEIKGRGGNVEESRMAVLGAEFGVMMLVGGSADVLSAVERELPKLAERLGLGVLTRRTKAQTRAAGLPCTLVASAFDQEGIVHSLADALGKLGVNIVSLETSTYHASMSGAPLFRFEAALDVPRGVGLASLRAHLVEVSKSLDLDVDLRT